MSKKQKLKNRHLPDLAQPGTPEFEELTNRIAMLHATHDKNLVVQPKKGLKPKRYNHLTQKQIDQYRAEKKKLKKLSFGFSSMKSYNKNRGALKP